MNIFKKVSKSHFCHLSITDEWNILYWPRCTLCKRQINQKLPIDLVPEYSVLWQYGKIIYYKITKCKSPNAMEHSTRWQRDDRIIWGLSKWLVSEKCPEWEEGRPVIFSGIFTTCRDLHSCIHSDSAGQNTLKTMLYLLISFFTE